MTIDALFLELRKRGITLITKPDRIRLYPASKISDLLPELKTYRDLILKDCLAAEARVNAFGRGISWRKWLSVRKMSVIDPDSPLFVESQEKYSDI